MKSKFLKVLAIVTCLLPLGACGNDNDEPQLERTITVTSYESLSPKGNEFYNPKTWSYTNTMLFACQPAEIDKTASTASLANDKLTLTSGQTINAKYKSDSGLIVNAEYGNYTLVVYCTGNPFNAYLEHRWMCQPLNYTQQNSVTDLNCCFVWEDMKVGGGYCQWQTK